MNIDEAVLYPVQAAVEQWTDKRVISDVDLENLLLFIVYGQKVFSQIGMRLEGFSCRQKQGQTLLTVKVREGDTPLVVFITSDTTTGCIVRLLDLLESDRLNFVKDRFPWI